ncbi:hypothetical protein L2E82_22401 [Cichorium intybus]|uniref:Uncharacterized protein n=1 Tax=Cichorium intybus TaxID=13427 RepID=A0ACB9DYN6_CICIN|nr:hypothetical protein L2E82_22401 [Cichorium intybus]
MWMGKVPSLAHIKVWGCEAFVGQETQDKLAERNEESFERERELISKEDSRSTVDLEEIQETPDETTLGESSHQHEEEVLVGPTDILLPLRRSDRVSMPPEFYGFHITTDGDTFVSDRTLTNLDEPANYREAVAGPESAKWKKAMDSEIKSMYDNQVWNLVDNVPGRKTVGCKWIFKKKTDMDSKVHTYKARLVAKGFTQTPGMDVKIAFLNGKLTEDVYMNQPEGFEDTKHPDKVCKLERSIYGLKQASRSWNLCFYEKVQEQDQKKTLQYVDDILLMGNDVPTLQDVKSWLGKCFDMKDLGEAAYILGIRILRHRKKRLIGLSQCTYLEKVLKRFSIENSKKGELPIQSNAKLSKTQSPSTDEEIAEMSRVPYASALGSIMYVMACTRLVVSFALSMNMVLVLGGSDDLKVSGYTDASFQTDRDNGRSQSGWVFLLNGGAITWKSYKQETVADSTCESEYIATSEASKEAAWLKNFIGDLGVVPIIQEPMELFSDNEGAVGLTKEPRDHGKSRHTTESTITFDIG